MAEPFFSWPGSASRLNHYNSAALKYVGGKPSFADSRRGRKGLLRVLAPSWSSSSPKDRGVSAVLPPTHVIAGNTISFLRTATYDIKYYVTYEREKECGSRSSRPPPRCMLFLPPRSRVRSAAGIAAVIEAGKRYPQLSASAPLSYDGTGAWLANHGCVTAVAYNSNTSYCDAPPPPPSPLPPRFPPFTKPIASMVFTDMSGVPCVGVLGHLADSKARRQRGRRALSRESAEVAHRPHAGAQFYVGGWGESLRGTVNCWKRVKTKTKGVVVLLLYL